MPDPNNRRDKALEDIARSLKDIAKILSSIEHQGRKLNRPDPFVAPQQEPEALADSTFPYAQSGNPYFQKRSE